ncbi:Hypothetical Protein SLY_1111 [Strawberry lethal yellows phytoplasma (CPA) str. NZSb11]|uniref:Uncharacterized protein n=1 Tax=Strawberry lethal yellows phytoplasma (CPA) str. NZSb11 TaxID=980422 RepID=R4RYQ1_PHYAS|nr:Hypothetical Protein SLY_1111 [Strawberry lethal yellows phytoplasma (CPA) str. NZSb11]
MKSIWILKKEKSKITSNLTPFFQSTQKQKERNKKTI